MVMANPSEIFGSHVFDLRTMKKRLPKETFKALKSAIENDEKLGLADANTVAHLMMEWALARGATHYTHLFQPMTGLTAEKHDAFFNFDYQFGSIEGFTGKELIQGEPDASSFPSGGMRTTFEARGYTAWDPSSPVYVMINGDVTVLCIPSVFFSYTGHALDKKTPLLRSNKALNREASRALKLLDGRDVKVEASVGVEQEYFLVDKKYFDQRPDLVMAGRTLLGCPPAKGQQMDDHYFGSIKDRVLSCMEEIETRLYKLGVPCKTRHNEVAPHQFEMAPIFEPANLAADHNQLVMEVIKKVARGRGLAALFHEKPFAGVNGSGKHINWSMQTSDGANLLEPGKEPHRNLVFLYFLVAVLSAVHKRGGVLRSTIASPGNDHRLGANEAPPAIVSVFLGSHLSKILDQILAAEKLTQSVVASIDLGLAQLPEIRVDTTDRNRTSPFAFTGNKFEFRAVGSSQSVSFPITVLNAAVVESLNEMNDELEKIGQIGEKSILKLLRTYIRRSQPIRFEGNNYSAEWAEEAARRGLPNLKTTPEAFSVWQDPDVRAFVIRTGFLNEQEMDSRYHVRMEHYCNILSIEAVLTLRLVNGHVLPPCFRAQKEVADSISAVKAMGNAALAESLSNQEEFLADLTSNIGHLLVKRNNLQACLDEVIAMEDEVAKAHAFAQQVAPLMGEVRNYCDQLELVVDAEAWTLPSYHELLFLM